MPLGASITILNTEGTGTRTGRFRTTRTMSSPAFRRSWAEAERSTARKRSTGMAMSLCVICVRVSVCVGRGWAFQDDADGVYEGRCTGRAFGRWSDPFWIEPKGTYR